MIEITEKKNCCGCGACVSACPVGCITMERDEEGFSYPKVDKEKCINCGKCERVCPVLTVDRGEEIREKVYPDPCALGGWNRDEKIREASSSGGAFSLFAEEILKEGGVVFGARYRDHRVTHVAVTDSEGLAALRGSKYVQSEIGDCYQKAKEYLDQGRKVLFTGTPCQTAGLRTFLGKPDPNLWLVDFICHGVPSPMVFEEYLRSVEEKSGAEITAFSFREKDKGWQSSGLQLGTKITLSDGTVIRNYPALKDTYMNGFLEDIYLRPSCYSCRFKSMPKWGADITIADFWGIDRFLPEMNDGKGTSLLLVNSEQGRRLFSRVKDGFEYKRINWKRATHRNPPLTQSAKRPKLRDTFFAELEQNGYDRTAKKHMTTGKAVVKKAARIMKNKIKGGH